MNEQMVSMKKELKFKDEKIEKMEKEFKDQLNEMS